MNARASFLVAAVVASACGSARTPQSPDGAGVDASAPTPDLAAEVGATKDAPVTVDATVSFDAAPSDRHRDVAELMPPKQVAAGPCGVQGGVACPVTYSGAVGFDLRWFSPALAPDGALILGGGFNQKTDFDFTSGMDVRTPSDLNWGDGFVTSVAPSGAPLGTWTFDGGGVGAVSATAGAVVAVGSFKETVDLDPGPGVRTLVNPDATWSASYAVKLTSAGAHVWSRALTSTADGFVYWIRAVAAPDGTTYLLGTYDGAPDLDPGPARRWPSDTHGAFVMRLDAGGDLMWVRTLGGVDCTRAEVFEIALGAGGAPWFTGAFEGTCAFDKGGSRAKGTRGLFLSSLTPAGDERSLQTFIDDGFGSALGVAPDGAVYLTAAAVVRAFDAAGALRWMADLPDGLTASAVAANPNGGVLVAGAVKELPEGMFVLALDAEHRETWRFEVGSRSLRPVALFAGTKDFLVVGTKAASDDVDPSVGVDAVSGAPAFAARFAF
jgi:hypothetical protein